jgi:hypothetical protein
MEKKNTKSTILSNIERPAEARSSISSDGKDKAQKTTHGNPQNTSNMPKKLSESIKRDTVCRPPMDPQLLQQWKQLQVDFAEEEKRLQKLHEEAALLLEFAQTQCAAAQLSAFKKGVRFNNTDTHYAPPPSPLYRPSTPHWAIPSPPVDAARSEIQSPMPIKAQPFTVPPAHSSLTKPEPSTSPKLRTRKLKGKERVFSYLANVPLSHPLHPSHNPVVYDEAPPNHPHHPHSIAFATYPNPYNLRVYEPPQFQVYQGHYWNPDYQR